MAERILNIDDSDAGRYATNRILQRGGFITIEASTGKGGLQTAIEEQPDLILLDVNLPDVNGFDICRQLKSDPRTASIPVLMMSASFVAKRDQVKGLEGGADGYLTEPLEPEVLIAHIRALLRMRQAEQRMEEAHREAEEANRAKDHFLAVLSHELRTPLNPALAAIDLLSEYDLADDVRAMIEVIRRNLLLETRLIDDLLDVTRIAKGKLQMTSGDASLHTLIYDVIEICQSDISSKQQSLTLDLAAQHHAIHADAARILQVIWNLVKNAVKFTPAGGSITIRTDNPTPQSVRLQITDSGIGIEEHLLGRIFNAFDQGNESTNRQFGGLGLGLAISKNIIDAHNGQLSAASDGAATGATFTLVLPLAGAAAAA
jgi:two-component system, sensor histidine kinase